MTEFNEETVDETVTSSADAEASESSDFDAAAAVDDQLGELTADLQRLQAEYSNYRKRVERDRAVARDSAIGDVLNALLPVLDDFGRAREHGELTGAFKSVSDAFDGIVSRFGLEVYGAIGEDFDPAVHEALTHQTADIDGPTTTVVTAIYQVGFRHAGRVLRPARVGVEDIASAQSE
jgi:molecular chaperone GrpE